MVDSSLETDYCILNFETQSGTTSNIQPDNSDNSDNSYLLYLPINGTIINIINSDGRAYRFQGSEILKAKDYIAPLDDPGSATLTSQSYQTNLISVKRILTEQVYGSVQPFWPFLHSQSPNPDTYIVLKFNNIKLQSGLAVGPRNQVNVNILTKCRDRDRDRNQDQE